MDYNPKKVTKDSLMLRSLTKNLKKYLPGYVPPQYSTHSVTDPVEQNQTNQSIAVKSQFSKMKAVQQRASQKSTVETKERHGLAPLRQQMNINRQSVMV